MTLESKVKTFICAALISAATGCNIQFQGEVRGTFRARLPDSIYALPKKSTTNEEENRNGTPGPNITNDLYRPNSRGIPPCMQDPPYVEPRLRYDLRK